MTMTDLRHLRDRPRRDTSHMRQEATPWGTVDDAYFTPASEEVLRCPHCSLLMDGSFTQEGYCPNCKAKLTKAQWRDAYVEALSVKARGGWSREILDEYAGRKGSQFQRGDGSVRAVDSHARRVGAAYVAGKAEALRRAKVSGAMIDWLRNQNEGLRGLR